MKFVFVNRYFYPDHSATSQLLTDLAFHLSEQGYQVLVVTSRQRIDDPLAALPVSERHGTLEILRVWTSRFGRDFLLLRAFDYLSFYWSVARVLRRHLSGEDVVVAKTDPPLISLIVIRAARRCGARQVNWLHDLFPEVASAAGVRGMHGGFAERLRTWRNRSLRDASMNVVLGQHMAERVHGLGIAPERVRIIHNWCDGDAVYPMARGGHKLRTDWGLEGKFVVMYSGNMGRVHEFHTLVDAAAGLRDEPGIVFVLIGGGAWHSWLSAEVKERRLGNLRLLPYQKREKLRDSLTAGDVHLISLLPEMEGLVVPSKFYGIAAAGRPAVFIGDQDGEIARILRAGNCGVTVPCGDVVALARILRELYHAPKRCEKMGRAAREAYEQHYSRRQALARWQEILTKI